MLMSRLWGGREEPEKNPFFKKKEKKKRENWRILQLNIKTNYLSSPTLSFSRLSSSPAFSMSVHMCGWERSAQELKMSELTKPYLKIASFCK